MLNLKSQQLFQLCKVFPALFDLQQTPCTCQGHINLPPPLGKASAVHVVGGEGEKKILLIRTVIVAPLASILARRLSVHGHNCNWFKHVAQLVHNIYIYNIFIDIFIWYIK